MYSLPVLVLALLLYFYHLFCHYLVIRNYYVYLLQLGPSSFNYYPTIVTLFHLITSTLYMFSVDIQVVYVYYYHFICIQTKLGDMLNSHVGVLVGCLGL